MCTLVGAIVFVLELAIPAYLTQEANTRSRQYHPIASPFGHQAKEPHLNIGLAPRTFYRAPRVLNDNGLHVSARYEFPFLTVDNNEIPLDNICVSLEPILREKSYPILVIDLSSDASFGRITELLDQLRKIKLDGSVLLTFSQGNSPNKSL